MFPKRDTTTLRTLRTHRNFMWRSRFRDAAKTLNARDRRPARTKRIATTIQFPTNTKIKKPLMPKIMRNVSMLATARTGPRNVSIILEGFAIEMRGQHSGDSFLPFSIWVDAVDGDDDLLRQIRWHDSSSKEKRAQPSQKRAQPSKLYHDFHSGSWSKLARCFFAPLHSF